MKVVRFKVYKNLKLIPMPTFHWKNLFINFIISFSGSTNPKSANYNLILVILNYFTKVIYYKLVKVFINALKLAKALLNMIVWYYSFFDFIIINWGFLFISMFGFLPCYFFDIKWYLLMAFHLKTDSQTKWKNSIIKVYLQAFSSFEQNYWN